LELSEEPTKRLKCPSNIILWKLCWISRLLRTTFLYWRKLKEDMWNPISFMWLKWWTSTLIWSLALLMELDSWEDTNCSWKSIRRLKWRIINGPRNMTPILSMLLKELLLGLINSKRWKGLWIQQSLNDHTYHSNLISFFQLLDSGFNLAPGPPRQIASQNSKSVSMDPIPVLQNI